MKPSGKKTGKIRLEGYYDCAGTHTACGFETVNPGFVGSASLTIAQELIPLAVLKPDFLQKGSSQFHDLIAQELIPLAVLKRY